MSYSPYQWLVDRRIMRRFGWALAIVWTLIILTGCANHCRIDQRVPEGATFEDAQDLKREDCK